MQSNARDEILNQFQSRSLSEQIELLEELKAIISRQLSAQSQPRHKAREFRGVGRETWKDVDVEEYLRQERASWDR